MQRVIALLFYLFISTAAADDNQGAVQMFVDAFNAKDIDAMLAVAHEDIQWMYVSDSEIHIETSGQQQLRNAMTDYFDNIPSASSELISISGNGSHIQAIEKASWRHSDGNLRSQCSLSVYQLADGKIARVWYYPAEPCD